MQKPCKPIRICKVFCKMILYLRENADLEVSILWRSWEGDDVSNILHTGDK